MKRKPGAAKLYVALHCLVSEPDNLAYKCNARWLLQKYRGHYDPKKRLKQEGVAYAEVPS